MRFDERARTYDANSLPQRSFAARVSEFLDCSPGDRVLELGAGTGALTAWLCSRPGLQVLATDASQAMVALGKAAVPKAEWHVLDAFREKLPRAKLQVSSGLLQWAEDPVQVLRSWQQALEPGARMVHAFPCKPCLQEWREVLKDSPVRWRDEDDWLDIFSTAGLRVARKSLWMDRWVFGSALDMVRSMHRSGVTGQVRVGPGSLRSAMRVYDTRYRTVDGVTATWAWLAVEAFR
jgi:trans-aconitate methyltransferase